MRLLFTEDEEYETARRQIIAEAIERHGIVALRDCVKFYLDAEESFAVEAVKFGATDHDRRNAELANRTSVLAALGCDAVLQYLDEKNANEAADGN